MALSTGSKGFLVVLLLLTFGVGGGVALLGGAPRGADGPAEGETVVFEVPEGAGASQVADDLEAAGVIRSATAFRLAARFDDRANQLRPGTYELTVGMGTDEIMEALSTAPEPAETFRVTIPEGYTVSQTLERIAEAGPHHVQTLEAALAAVALPDWVPVADLPEGAQELEGLLFPDTYEFLVTADAQEVVSKLVEQTDIVLGQITPPAGMTRYDVLIIASLIEREARVREEQAVISSVIHNRLARPMRLQIDATVQYARGEHTDRVLFEDLEIDSAWNTYEVDGLPPTPIAGAGRSAIAAAAEPQQTGYLYYVVDDLETGTHAFATTQAEHEANVAEYRRLRAEAESGDGDG
jgi:UPF0755 protein